MKTIIKALLLFISINSFSQITYFADRATFNAEYADGTFEDFEGGPTSSGNTGCDGDFSVAGNSCYPAGELQPGFVITSSDNTNDNPTVYTAEDFAGNPTGIVGTNQFEAYTILNFPTGQINAVALDLYGLPFASTMHVRIFDNSGLIENVTITDGLPGPYFFGFIANNAITSIEFEAEGSSVEMIGQLEFGTFENVSSLNDLSMYNFKYYPNPAKNTLNLKANTEITSIDIINVIGQHVKHNNTFSNKINLDISSLENGTYFIKVKIANKTEMFKFFKQ